MNSGIKVRVIAGSKTQHLEPDTFIAERRCRVLKSQISNAPQLFPRRRVLLGIALILLTLALVAAAALLQQLGWIR